MEFFFFFLLLKIITRGAITTIEQKNYDKTSVLKRVSAMTESEPMWNLTVWRCLACCDGCLQSLLNANACICRCLCVRTHRRVSYFFSRKPKQITIRNLQIQSYCYTCGNANAFSVFSMRHRLGFIGRNHRFRCAPNDFCGNGSPIFRLYVCVRACMWFCSLSLSRSAAVMQTFAKFIRVLTHAF